MFWRQKCSWLGLLPMRQNQQKSWHGFRGTLQLPWTGNDVCLAYVSRFTKCIFLGDIWEWCAQDTWAGYQLSWHWQLTVSESKTSNCTFGIVLPQLFANANIQVLVSIIPSSYHHLFFEEMLRATAKTYPRAKFFQTRKPGFLVKIGIIRFMIYIYYYYYYYYYYHYYYYHHHCFLLLWYKNDLSSMFLLVWMIEIFEIIWILNLWKTTQNICEFTACLNQLNPQEVPGENLESAWGRLQVQRATGVENVGDLTCVFRGFVVLCLWVCGFVPLLVLVDIKYCFIASLFVLGGVMFLLLMVDVLHFIQSVYFA